MKLKKRRLIVACLVLFFIVGIASAQWPTSPAAPLVVADRSGEQVQPKIAAIAGGGFYVSWFDNSAGGYDVYLQRLDVEGFELWPHDGVLVADRSFSSTQDYGLSVDTEGNALLAFRDDRVSPIQITAAKIAPDGSMLWGPGGVQVSSGNIFVASPRVTGTLDDKIVVAWTSDVNVMIQQLDASGAPQWGRRERRSAVGYRNHVHASHRRIIRSIRSPRLRHGDGHRLLHAHDRQLRVSDPPLDAEARGGGRRVAVGLGPRPGLWRDRGLASVRKLPVIRQR